MEILGDYTPSLKKALKEIDKNYEWYDALVIAGSHEPKDPEYIITRIKEYREAGKPVYGECYGHQLCAVEYARNVLGIKDATSEEWGQGTFVVKKRKDLNVGHKQDGSFWNNYEVDLPNWVKPPNMFTAQYHASYESSYWKPHPLLVEFINACKNYGK